MLNYQRVDIENLMSFNMPDWWDPSSLTTLLPKETSIVGYPVVNGGSEPRSVPGVSTFLKNLSDSMGSRLELPRVSQPSNTRGWVWESGSYHWGSRSTLWKKDEKREMRFQTIVQSTSSRLIINAHFRSDKPILSGYHHHYPTKRMKNIPSSTAHHLGMAENIWKPFKTYDFQWSSYLR